MYYIAFIIVPPICLDIIILMFIECATIRKEN